MEVGVDVLTRFRKDSTDRNRTSPFAFTGNKFEFRMLGSSLSISGPNIILNTIVAEVLSQFADRLEQTDDAEALIHELIKTTAKDHKRIIFNGNNYSDEWVKEAKERGLLNLKSTTDVLPYFISDKNIALFTKHKVFTETEIHSRYEILLENYCKVIHIEALTMLEMVKKDIIPAVSSYINDLTQTALNKRALLPSLSCTLEENIVQALSGLSTCLYNKMESLDDALLNKSQFASEQEHAVFAYDNIIPAMQELRAVADEIEILVGRSYWPYPTYGDLLFSV